MGKIPHLEDNTMKKNLVFIVITATCISLCGCGHQSPAPQDSSSCGCLESALIDNEEDDVMSTFSDTLTTEQYHQMIIEAIANDDRVQFAEMVCYPVRREYPIANIEYAEQMIRYFDTLFDESFRKKVASLDSNSWERMGWRGWMILDGEIWDTDPCIVVNYSSPTEQLQAEHLRKKDMARLHPSLRGNWKPFNCYHLDGFGHPGFKYAYARVDVSTGRNSSAEPVYRLALFKKGQDASEAPAVVMMGTYRVEGTLRSESFDFTSDDYYIHIEPCNEEDGGAYFSMKGRGGVKIDYVVPCRSKIQPF